MEPWGFFRVEYIPKNIYSLTEITSGGWDTYRFMIIIFQGTGYLIIIKCLSWSLAIICGLKFIFFYICFICSFTSSFVTISKIYISWHFHFPLCLWIMNLVDKIYMNHVFCPFCQSLPINWSAKPILLYIIIGKIGFTSYIHSC